MVGTPKATSYVTTPHAHLYRTARWLRMRKAQLMQEPLCRLCIMQGYTAPATVVDHIQPHKGDRELFFNHANLQSLCKTCHDSLKAQVERDGYHKAIGADGFPIDENHPVNLIRE